MSDHFDRDASEFPDATHKIVQSVSDTDYVFFYGTEAECNTFYNTVTGGDRSDMTLPHWNSISVEALS